MGLFDGIKPAPNPALNPQQAIMIIVIAAIKADGEIEDSEITRLRAMCSLSPIFIANTGAEDLALVGFATKFMNQVGPEAIRRAGEALTPRLRETAFSFACDMVLADGIVGDSEEQFMEKLVAQLRVDEGVARSIVNTTAIRNRALD